MINRQINKQRVIVYITVMGLTIIRIILIVMTIVTLVMIKVKGKIHKMVIQPDMLYITEIRSLTTPVKLETRSGERRCTDRYANGQGNIT